MGGRAMAVAADSNSREFGGGCCVVRLLLRAALQEQVVHLCGRAAYRQRAAAGWRGAAGAVDERESARGKRRAGSVPAAEPDSPVTVFFFPFQFLRFNRVNREFKIQSAEDCLRYVKARPVNMSLADENFSARLIHFNKIK